MKAHLQICVAMVATAFGSAQARDLPALDPVVITASRIAEPQGQATVLVEVISRQQIEESGAANVTELLDQVSGGLLTRQYGRLGIDAAFDLGYLGGASSQRTLIMVDGVRINDIDDATVRWGQLPLASIEQVEIRKAGGGVLFGDRALGGVVNIITRQAQDAGSAHATVGSFGTRVVGLHKSKNARDTRWQVSAQLAETDGYRQGAKQRLRSGQFGLFQATPRGEFGVAMRLSSEDTDRPAAIPLSTFLETPRIGSETSPGFFFAAERSGQAFELTWQLDHGYGADTLSRFTRDTSESKATFLSPSFVGTPTLYENQRDTFEIRRAARVLSGTVIAGVEYVDAKSSSNRSERARAEQISLAGYANIEIPVRETVMSAGIRRQSLENRFFNTTKSPPENAKESLTSWSLGGLSPVLSGQLRFNIQSSFSFPSADQLYTYSAGFPYAPLDIFPEVKAMRSNEMQMAYSRKLSTSYLQTGLRHILIKDEIGELLNCQGVDVSCNANLYDTRRVIFFLESRGRFSKDVTWTASADRIQSSIDSGSFAGNEVPLVPSLVLKASLSWSKLQNLYKLVANYRGEMLQSGDNANTRFRIPSRLTLDAGYTYTWPSKQRDMSLWIRNLTNRQYFDFAAWDGFSSGVAPADGRSIDLRLKQHF